jgi:Glycerate kinase family
MHGKILALALPFPGLWDSNEAAALSARFIRAADRSIGTSDIVTLPWLDGSSGTIDFLVTHSLGSFLEVEATGATGEEIIVPIGFAGEDGKLAVIEMARVASIANNAPNGQLGTTAGIGELVQDALDEGAFSVLLCHEEPLARDAGFGAGAALGVRFFDAQDNEVTFSHSVSTLANIMRVDISNRSFALLSSRIYLARSASAVNSSPSPEFLGELDRLATIIQRDTGIPPSLTNLSASAVEFGLAAFLGAEVRDGATLVLEASQIEAAIERGEFSEAVLLAPSIAVLDDQSPSLRNLLERIRARISRRAVIVTDTPEDTTGKQTRDSQYSLASVPIFQAPIGSGASMEERRRDFTMRLEKLIPTVLDDLRSKSRTKDRALQSRHA